MNTSPDSREIDPEEDTHTKPKEHFSGPQPSKTPPVFTEQTPGEEKTANMVAEKNAILGQSEWRGGPGEGVVWEEGWSGQGLSREGSGP